MKKLKGNVILTTFVLSMALLVLGIFGTDTAYIVLSRFKLQKITEALALEYASSLAASINNYTNSNRHGTISSQYKRVYDSKLSGLVALQVAGMRYKTILDKNGVITGTVVEVSTTASVLPAFLRFIGTKGIQIHSLAHAKTENSTYSDSTNIAAGKYFAEFNLNNIMTNKAMGQGDFALNFKYSDNENGGYFVFGSYKVNDRWTDLGYAANSSLQNKIEDVGICINSSNQNPLTFNLNTDNKTNLNGFTKRANKIRVYKSNGVSKDYFTGAQLNPCTPYNCKDHYPGVPPAQPGDPPTPPTPPSFPASQQQIWEFQQQIYIFQQQAIAFQKQVQEYRAYVEKMNNCMDYSENRNATVTLTVLNNVKLISKLQYQHPDVSDGGSIISGP